MQKFLIEGEFYKKGRPFKFKKEISASTENFAKEKLYCLFGSCHKVKRRFIKIKNIEVLPDAKESSGNEPSASASVN